MILENQHSNEGAVIVAKHGQKIRFVLAGGLNTMIGLAAYPVLYAVLNRIGMDYLIILAISQAFCICFAYLTNKFFVFKTQGGYVREYARFITFHGILFVLNLIVLRHLVERLHLSPVWSQLGFALFVIITSYLWHSNITFSSARKPSGALHDIGDFNEKYSDT